MDGMTPDASILLGGTSKVNEFKMEMTKVLPPAHHEFRPLKSWPFADHKRQSEIDALMRWPSGPSAGGKE